MWAAEQRHPEAVKALLAAGADPSLKSGGAGLPRNYMAQRVNTRAVEDAQKRRERAKAAGRTYDEQLEWENANGRIARRSAGRFCQAGSRSCRLRAVHCCRRAARRGGSAGGGQQPAPAHRPGWRRRRARPRRGSRRTAQGRRGQGAGRRQQGGQGSRRRQPQLAER